MLTWWVCVAVAAQSVSVSTEIPTLEPAGATHVVVEVLEEEGFTEMAGWALSADVTAAEWMYEQGLVQVELVVAWSMRQGSTEDVRYQGETRGLVTQVAPRRGLARRHRRTGTLSQLPNADAMRLEALKSATRSLAARDNFRAIVVGAVSPEESPSTDKVLNKHIDFADRSRLGSAPAHLRDPVVRSGSAVRTTGIVVAMVGMLVSITSRGSYLVSHEDPRERRSTVRAVEVSGWSMMAGGGALWFHGDRRARAW